MILLQPDTPSGIARVRFDIERVDFGAPEASGRQGGVQSGWPLWSARYELDRSDPDSADLWQAFFDRLRGRIRRFYAVDPKRRLPKLYRFGFAGMVRAGTSTPFDGTATSWLQLTDSAGDARITLNGLPAGLQISTGDMIGFRWDAADAAAGNMMRRTMARAVLPATANGAGQALVTVEPPLNTSLVPAGAIAHLDNPAVVMQLVPEDSQLGPIGVAGILSGGTITAIQDLRP
ncbi:hypothetical protein [Erythrobacter sp. WG]|uniref:hypothetical protein n=1 Tax=Erythrobacter sp. WG TaxID=2985510 RepID=UPI002271BDAE|nr:hypothetical protein [Erythrobacter sp. WG]MCX9146624.1 hypothetical protein [Erythrobacter sp. WG]